MHSTVFSVLQLQIEAYDTSFPKSRSIGLVTINVNRNSNAPRFSQGLFEKTLSDDYPLVTEVLTVNATDPDGDALLYKLVENPDSAAAAEYFFMEENTGRLMLKKGLRDTVQEKFSVRYACTTCKRIHSRSKK